MYICIPREQQHSLRVVEISSKIMRSVYPTAYTETGCDVCNHFRWKINQNVLRLLIYESDKSPSPKLK